MRTYKTKMKSIDYGNIVRSVYFTLDTFCPHRMEDHVLFYVESGEIEMTECNHVTRLRHGDCAFIRKDCNVMMNKKIIDDKPFVATFLKFKRDFLQEIFSGIDKATLPSDSSRDHRSVLQLPGERPDIKSLFDSLKPYFESSITPTDDLLRLKMTEGLYVILNTDKNLYASLFDFAEPWKIDILDFLNSNFRNDLSIGEMANFTGRSLSAFKRDFKKLSDLTPGRWLIRRRLEEAHSMLQTRTGKISDICYAVGFKNLSHFSKAYKRQYGVSPIRK